MDLPNILRNYFGRDLGAFYVHAPNRLMLYPFVFSFFLVECSSFWLLYMGPAFVMHFLAFTTVFSLHKAGGYTLCILAADILAHYLLPSWGLFQKRTVGRQWLIWSLGLAAGFVLQQTMVRRLVLVYAPEVVNYFRAHPQAHLGTLTLLAILLPYWGVVLFITMRVAWSRQEIQKLADAITIQGSDDMPASTHLIPADQAGVLPAGRLKLGSEDNSNVIVLADITHVSVEDHYCRVSCADGNGLKSTMIRLPLKEMLAKLPREYFVQIHRSHVINQGHVWRLSKSGRDHKVVMHETGVELPVSRSRSKALLYRLKNAGAAGT